MMNRPSTTERHPDSWRGAHAKARGAGHVRRELPCQDAAAAGHDPRPFLVVCDGRGSASRSEEGAQRAVAAFERAMAALSPLLTASLDDTRDAGQAARRWALTAETLASTAAAEQWLLTRESEIPATTKDFEFTMVAAVVGKRYVGWLRMGDSQLVAIRNGLAGLVDAPEEFEWTNQTRFVRYGRHPGSGLSRGVFPAGGTDALFAFSDGVAPRVLDCGFAPLETFRQIHVFAQANPEQTTASIHSLLNRDDWAPRVQDDRCLATLWKTEQSARYPFSIFLAPQAPAPQPRTAGRKANADDQAAPSGPVHLPVPGTPSARKCLPISPWAAAALYLIMITAFSLVADSPENHDRKRGEIQTSAPVDLPEETVHPPAPDGRADASPKEAGRPETSDPLQNPSTGTMIPPFPSGNSETPTPHWNDTRHDDTHRDPPEGTISGIRRPAQPWESVNDDQ